MAPKNRPPTPKPERASLARSPWRIALLAAILVGTVVAVIVVPGGRSSPSDAAPSAAPDSPPSGGAPTIALTSLNGQPLRLPAAGRPGMVMFSSSICTSCFVAAAFMGDYKQTHQGVDAAFVSVDPNYSRQALNDRHAALGDRAFPFAVDTSGQLFASYRVASLGTVIFYDRAGNIRRSVIEPSLVDIENAFRKLAVS
jgi:cytochrome oxidase Cu insertion factor (SCO1/SenC/PrrC family)